MFGRKSESYKSWKKEWKKYKEMSQSLDFANLGSTCDANNFDYSYWPGSGYNFASAPQDMYYDFQVLEQYGDRLKEGAYLFISISEFAFLVYRYDTDYHNHKYYGYLDYKRIWGYTRFKEKLIRHCPGIVDSRYIKQEIKQLLQRFQKKQDNIISLKELSSRSMVSWQREFGWDRDLKLTDVQIATINKCWDVFLKEVSFCKKRNIIPVVIIPPFNRYLKEIMPQSILDECLWPYIEKIRDMGIKVVDFWNDNELEKEKYYRTPICLNEKGKKIFNIKLQDLVFQDSHKSYNTVCACNSKEHDYAYKLKEGFYLPQMAFGTGVIKRFYRNKPLYYKDVVVALLRSIKRMRWVRFLKNDFTIMNTINSAIKCGYRLFDTGRLYGHSEKYIGKVLSKYNRNDFFIITKVCDVDFMRYPNSKSVRDNLTISLNNLQTDYVDAYLLHHPSGDWISIYKEMEIEYENGRTRAIGVCNLDLDELKRLISEVKICPMICQLEIHPLNTKKDIVAFCQENGIVVMAHTPTGRMSKEIIEAPGFNQIVERHGKTAAQIIYRWHYQNRIIPIVASTSRNHLEKNLDIFDFELSALEMEYIDSMNRDYSFDPYGYKINDCPDFVYNI